MAKQVTQKQHDFYKYQEYLADRAGYSFLKQHGLSKQHVHMPNVNLYCKAKLLSTDPMVSNKDVKYCNNFMRFWLAKDGVITKKAKTKMLTMIKYYSHKQQNLALRNARLQRKNNLKLKGTEASKC